MNAVYHAKSSAAKWGGDWQAYLPVHNWIEHYDYCITEERADDVDY